MSNQTSEALCARCAWAGGCTIPEGSDEPVATCGSFKDIEVVWRSLAYREADQPDPSRAEGLCVDCGNRRSCLYRGREGGTWHCEEYR